MIVGLWVATNKFSIKMGLLDLKVGVIGGNTPPKVLLSSFGEVMWKSCEKSSVPSPKYASKNYDMPKNKL